MRVYDEIEKPKHREKPPFLQRLTPLAILMTVLVTVFVVEQHNRKPRMIEPVNQRPELVEITGGTFLMGTTQEVIDRLIQGCNLCMADSSLDSMPAVPVQIDTFRMETTEVTFEKYVAFLNYRYTQGKNHLDGCQGKPCLEPVQHNLTNPPQIVFDKKGYRISPILAKNPVYGVSWYGAEAYCASLGRRLPTEAEWEFAARGIDGRIYPWGNGWNAAFASTSEYPSSPSYTPVGSYPEGATPEGLLDMAGSVSEWVNDWYAPDYYAQIATMPQPVRNPQGPESGTHKVVRGGMWQDEPFFVSTFQREAWFPVMEYEVADIPHTTGFRCVEDVQ